MILDGREVPGPPCASILDTARAAGTTSADYPLVLTTGRLLERYHSGTMTRRTPALDWLVPEALMDVHPDDAARPGIADGDRVRVFNHRGATHLPARVTERIAPGVVSIREGAWFTPDADGHDTRGCANVLTDDRASPAGASPFNTCFVDVARA